MEMLVENWSDFDKHFHSAKSKSISPGCHAIIGSSLTRTHDCLTSVARSAATGAKGWPNYQRCVENAPQARAGGRPDISRPDFTFYLLAIDSGWSVEEVADLGMAD
jgi:hypothetical protein